MKANKTSLSISDSTIPRETVVKSGVLDAKDKDPRLDQLLGIVASKGTNINDAEAVFEILPDVRYASDLIVSETLSPKDLTPPEINITIDTTGTEINLDEAGIIKQFKDHFSEGGAYDLESSLYRYLEESLVTAGAVCLLTLKKSDIDGIITSTNASGGKYDTFSFESAKLNMTKSMDIIFKQDKTSVLKDLGITVTDNVNEFKVALVESYKQEVKLKELGMENARVNTLSFLETERFADSADGEPIVFKWPVESVIPVHVPGSPDRHVGYYVAMENGYPISHKKDSSEIAKLEKRVKELLNGTKDSFKQLFTIAPGSNGQGKDTKLTSKDYIDIYTTKVKKELESGLKKGLLGGNFNVSSHEDAYMLMLHRKLDNRDVKLVYVPAGMMDYIAFDYDARGVGKSLIEKTKLFSSIRIAMLIADIFASIKNSIPTTNVEVTIDEKDTDPYTTLELVKDKISRLTGASMPIGPIQPSEIFDVLQKASINFTVEGGDAFPNTRATIVDGQRQVVKADTELMEVVKKMQLSGLGVSPEKVDRALEGDYAISTHTTNLLEARRIMMRQMTYERKISAHVRNYIRLSPTLSQSLTALFKGMPLEKILPRVKFKLPDADTNKITAQLEAYEQASNLIEAMVEDIISDTMFRDMFQGDYLGRSVDGWREILAGHFKIEWAREQGIMLEVIEATSNNNEGMSEAIKDKLSNIIRLYSDVYESVIKDETKGQKGIGKQVEKLQGGNAATPPAATPTTPAEPDPFDEQADPFAVDEEGTDEGEGTGTDEATDEGDGEGEAPAE